jgi:exopolysaccharide biosynthesis protein
MVLSLSPELLARLPTEAGAVLKISTATSPDLKGVKTAIGGGPALVHNGQPVRADRQLQLEHRTALGRHPRSAIGWNKKFFFLVEVDGRQPDLSMGMSFPELGNYLAKLGCEEALNLDGGGSSTFWVDGHVVNSPCDGTERSVANALVVVRKETGQGR